MVISKACGIPNPEQLGYYHTVRFFHRGPGIKLLANLLMERCTAHFMARFTVVPVQ